MNKYKCNLAPAEHIEECIGDCRPYHQCGSERSCHAGMHEDNCPNNILYPLEKTVREMEIGDTVGFNDGNKHWTITRDE